MTPIETKLKGLEELDKFADSFWEMKRLPADMDAIEIWCESAKAGEKRVARVYGNHNHAALISTYRNETPKLIAALREAVSALNYVADYENVGRSVYSDTDPERARQSLTNIEKILNGEQK